MKALYNDGTVAELPEDEVTHVVRHSAAHVMAQAIKRLYPEADFAYGPATDNGFYYDIDLPDGQKISENDFPAIEDEMKKIVKENLKFSVYELPARRGHRPYGGARREVQGRAHRRPRSRTLASPSTSRASTSTCASVPTSAIPRRSRPSSSPAFPVPIGRTTRTTRCSRA